MPGVRPQKIYMVWAYSKMEERGPDFAFQAESLAEAVELLGAKLGKITDWNAWCITFPRTVFHLPKNDQEWAAFQSAHCTLGDLLYRVPGMNPQDQLSYLFLRPHEEESRPLVLCEAKVAILKKTREQKAVVSR